MNPAIQALYELQQRDRQLTALERKLALIPKRLSELEQDIGKLEEMLNTERRKCDDTRAFQRNQEIQLEEEEELLQKARAKMGQVSNPRELNAIQREIDQTRRMASARTDEINKIKAGVEEAESRIEAVSGSLEEFRAQADAEKQRLLTQQHKFETRIGKLREGRSSLTDQIEIGLRRTYDRIRSRTGGIAFVPAAEGRCTACKMHVPHQTYTQLRKGEEIMSCESCGRLLYWIGHFKDEEEARAKEKENKPKVSPPQKRPAPKDD